MLRSVNSWTLFLVLVAIGGLSGCENGGSGVSPEVLQKQQVRLVLSEEPEEGLQTVADVRTTLLSGAADQDHDHDGDGKPDHEPSAHAGPMEVVMVGCVGGLTNPWEKTQPAYPFGKGQAVLFVADPGEVAQKQAEGHVHAPGEECPFCAAHAAETSEMIAMVRFLGEDGKVLEIESQELFGLEPMDTVVVQGTATIEGGMMVVDAYGLYLRK